MIMTLEHFYAKDFYLPLFDKICLLSNLIYKTLGSRLHMHFCVM